MDFPQTPSTSKKDASKRTPAAKRSLDQALGEVLEGTPKSKRPRPKVNQALWKHFSEKEDDLDYAICQIRFKKTGRACGAEIKKPDGSTSGMTKHFRARHPDEYKNYLVELAGDKEEYADNVLAVNNAEILLEEAEDRVREKLGKPTPLKKVPHTKPISAYMLSKSPLKYKNNSARQKRIDFDVMLALSRGNLAFATVDQPWFRE
jgi:BED zinc finger